MIDPQALAKDSLIKAEFLGELKANGLSQNTLRAYRNSVNSLKPLAEKPEDLDKQDIVKWAGMLRDEYAPATQNLYKVCVKRYFKWLRTGDLDGGEDPEEVDWLKIKRTHSLPKEILSHKEIKQMAESSDCQRDRAMIWSGYESGCRSGEFLA